MRLSSPARVVAVAALTVALTAVPVPSQAAARAEVDVYDTAVNENGVSGRARLTVRLAEKATSPVKVTWRTVDGTAKAGKDYFAKSGKVVFARGQRVKTITVVTAEDDVPEATELFHVSFASKQARVTRKRATVTVIDDDVTTYTGRIAVTSRAESDVNGFYTLETWTLTFHPRLVPVFQGTAWYDDGHGFWELAGSRVLEDHRPGAGCRVLEKETWSGAGYFFSEPHPDSDVTTSVGNLVMQNFFPQHAGNLGTEPLLHVAVDGYADGTQYSFEDGSCVGTPYEQIRRFALEEAPGEVETDGRGQVPVFDHHVVEDNSSADGLDLYELEVEGDLAPMVE